MIRLIQNLSVLVFLTGIILLIYYVSKTKLNCPPNLVKYKFLHRIFEQEQENLPRPSNVFSDMFKLPSTWIGYSNINPEEDSNNDSNNNDSSLNIEPANSQNLFASIE